MIPCALRQIPNMKLIAIDRGRSQFGTPGTLFLQVDEPIEPEVQNHFLRLWETYRSASYPDLPDVSFAEGGLKLHWQAEVSPGFLGELISNALGEATEKLVRDKAAKIANQNQFLERASKAFGLPVK